MKKIMFLLALISGILVFVVSCSKDDDATTATSSDGCTAVTSCSYTTSGSISGAAGDNVTLTGTYDKFIQASTTFTIDNTTGCISDSTLLGMFGSAIPDGTQSAVMQIVITGSDSFADRASFYTGTGCQSGNEIARYVFGRTNLTWGDNVSGLSTSGKPSTASKFTYTDSCMILYPDTTVGTTFLNSLISSSGITLTQGNNKTCADNGNTKHGILHLSDSTWDGTANDNRTLLLAFDNASEMSTWDISDPDTYTRID